MHTIVHSPTPFLMNWKGNRLGVGRGYRMERAYSLTQGEQYQVNLLLVIVFLFT